MITYPRDFPDFDIVATRCNFDYTTLGEMSRTAGGAITFQERIGGSLWELSLTTKPLNETEYGKWHAWYLSLRGGRQSFYGRDPRRCWPLEYGKDIFSMVRAGGGAFDGSCTITAVAGDTITIGNLPASFKISVGDYVSFDWLGGRALVKALEPITGTTGGVAGPFTVGPWQRTGGTLPAAGSLSKPWCLMRPKPGSWQGSRGVVEPVTFEAIQTLV